MTFGAFLALLLAGLFALLYFLLSLFAQALEGISDLRRKALLEEAPGRFGKLLSAVNERPARIAARLTAQAAVLGGLFFTASALAGLGVPSPWLVAAAAILVGWILLEFAVVRTVSRQGAETILVDFWWQGPRYQRQMLWGVAAIWLLFMVPAVVVIGMHMAERFL